MYVHVIIFVLSLLHVDYSSGALQDINPRTLKVIEDEVRGILILKALNSVNSTLTRQQELILGCETDINRTLVNCERCKASNPGSNTLAPNFLSGIVSELNKPIMAMDGFFGNANQDIADLGGILGSKSEEFAHLTTSTLKNIGTFLSREAEKALEEAKKTLSTTGQKFSELGKAISNAIDSSGGFVNGVSSFGSQMIEKLNNLPNILSNGASTVLGSFTNVVSFPNIGDKIMGSLVDIGNSIGGLFSGRRKRSVFPERLRRHTNACPECKKIEQKTNTRAEIVNTVCGTTFTNAQQRITSELEKLRKVYEWSKNLTNAIINKISYDDNLLNNTRVREQILTATPLMVTYLMGGSPQTYQSNVTLNIFNPTDIAVDLAGEIFTKV